MNENLIRQLAYKVLLKTGTPTGSDEWQQLFAELIVKECAKVCDDLDIDDWGDKSFDDGTYYCSRAIKQHFGVEE